MVGFHINLNCKKACNTNLDASKILQASKLQKTTKYIMCQSETNAFRKISIGSTSSSLNHKSYQCSMCQKIFNNRNTYQNHLRSHGKNDKDPYCCNICRKSFTVPARLTRHYRTHTGEKPYQCEYCNKSFSVKENLSVHRRIHTKERPYKCDVCDSAFEHSGKLHRHMRIHTGERPHKCSVCNKTFIQSGQLVIHMRTHTGEKPYICKSCGKGFTCSKQLKVHTRTHTGEKPYTCDICGKSFGYNHVLKLHQVAHYGEKCYKCTLCHETFNSKKLMELHIKTHSDSSINNFPKPTELHFENCNNTNEVVVLDYINNHGFPISEKKKEKYTEIESESLNYLHYNSYKPITLQIQKQPNQSDNPNVPTIITDQRYLFLKTNAHTSKYSKTISTDAKLTQGIAKKGHLSTHQCSFDDSTSNNSCLYEIQNNDFFSKECLQTFHLPSNNLRQSVKTNFEFVTEEQQSVNKELESCDGFTLAYHNKVAAPLYTNTLNFVIPNVRDNYSLPPRKRCKMILESMETENLKLQTTTKRYHSVIRFAKTENISSDRDPGLHGNG